MQAGRGRPPGGYPFAQSAKGSPKPGVQLAVNQDPNPPVVEAHATPMSLRADTAEVLQIVNHDHTLAEQYKLERETLAKELNLVLDPQTHQAIRQELLREELKNEGLSPKADNGDYTTKDEQRAKTRAEKIAALSPVAKIIFDKNHEAMLPEHAEQIASKIHRHKECFLENYTPEFNGKKAKPEPGKGHRQHNQPFPSNFPVPKFH
jgi:hypothetical protein